MTSPDANLLPRSRVVTLSPPQVLCALRLANLGDDPYDPRQALVLAAQAFLDWTVTECDEFLEAGEETEGTTHTGLASGGSLWGRWREGLQRASSVIDMTYNGHRVALLVVARHEDSSAPADYALPEDWVIQDTLRAICCVYVQTDSAGGMTALLEGWAEPKELARGFRRARSDRSGSFVIDRSSLVPMHSLWEVLQAPGNEVDALTAIEKEERRLRPAAGPALRRIALLVSAAAAAILCAAAAVLLWKSVTPPQLARPVLEWRFETDAVRGASARVPVVYSGQPYTVGVRVATGRPHGWLFQVDARGAYLLAGLKAEEAGVLTCSHSDRFDDRPGFEYFVIILADQRVSQLDEAQGKWLGASELEALQTCARQEDDDAALRVIRGALDRILPRGTKIDVQVLRVEHRSR